MTFPSPLAFLADLPQPTRPPGSVNGALHGVLSRPQYHYAGPSFLERIQNGIFDCLARVLTGVVGAGIGAWIVVVVVAALVALVTWRRASGVTRDPRPEIALSAGRRRPATDMRAATQP